MSRKTNVDEFVWVAAACLVLAIGVIWIMLWPKLF